MELTVWSRDVVLCTDGASRLSERCLAQLARNEIAVRHERITALETTQGTRSAQLSDPEIYGDDGKRRKLLADYQGDQQKLEELTGRWEAAAKEREVARGRLDAEDAATV
jgi:hypothetical protein